MSSGNIPDEIIEAILKASDIVEVVGKYVHLTKNGKYMKGLCPFHSEKTPSFTVTPEKQIYKCYGCGKGGTAIQFMMDIENYSFPEAVRHLAEDANIPFDWKQADHEPTERDQERQTLLEAYRLSAMLYNHLLKNMEFSIPAKQYLQKRGFSDAMIDRFQIGYAPNMWETLAQFLERRGFDPALMEKGGLLSERSENQGYYDKFRDRVMFPISDASGKVIAFGGRILGDGQPKYLNSPESILFRKSKLLYNLHQAKESIRKTRQVVLFEGYVDVIKAWEAGVTNGVATMGTALTEEHAILMRRFAEHVVICYDGDNAGQAAAYKSMAILEKAGLHATVSVIPNRMDPDEYITAYGADKFMNEMIRHAVSPTKFKLIYLRKNHILLEDDGKLNYVKDAVKIIAEVPSPTEREHYVKELSSEFEISFETLKQELNEVRQQQQQKINRHGDNIQNSWNTVMHEKRVAPSTPSLLPAYHNAERNLLAIMMQNDEVAGYVEQQLGDQFNVEAHAALAAYLYAYYAQGKPPDARLYMTSLKDDALEQTAASILMDMNLGYNEQVIDDYIREIKKVPRQKEIETKKEHMMRAERSGDVLAAAQIASEIIALERQLKLLQG